jgi:hypothetical protein
MENNTDLQNQVNLTNSLSIKDPKSSRGNFTSIFVLAGLFIIGIVMLIFFRKSILGPLTYKNCLETPGITKVDLDPKYCVTSNGDVFFENKKINEDNGSEVPTPIIEFKDPAL